VTANSRKYFVTLVYRPELKEEKEEKRRKKKEEKKKKR